MIFKRFERYAFVLLSVAATCCLVAGIYVFFIGEAGSGAWLASSGLLATAAGVVQLEVSGLLQKIMGAYGNEEKYPYGPPSHITCQIIDDPDRPVRTWIQNTCFFDIRTGFWLIVGGTLVQVAALWL